MLPTPSVILVVSTRFTLSRQVYSHCHSSNRRSSHERTTTFECCQISTPELHLLTKYLEHFWLKMLLIFPLIACENQKKFGKNIAQVFSCKKLNRFSQFCNLGMKLRYFVPKTTIFHLTYHESFLQYRKKQLRKLFSPQFS